MPDNSASPILPSRSPGGVTSTTTDKYRTEEVRVITQNNSKIPNSNKDGGGGLGTIVSALGGGVFSVFTSALSFKARPIEDTQVQSSAKDNSGLYIAGAILLIFAFVYFFSKTGKK